MSTQREIFEHLVSWTREIYFPDMDSIPAGEQICILDYKHMPQNKPVTDGGIYSLNWGDGGKIENLYTQRDKWKTLLISHPDIFYVILGSAFPLIVCEECKKKNQLRLKRAFRKKIFYGMILGDF